MAVRNASGAQFRRRAADLEVRRGVTGGHIGEIVVEDRLFAGHEIRFDDREFGLLRRERHPENESSR